MQRNNDETKLTATKKAWEKRSQQFGYKAEGVSTKSLPPVINKKLDLWMLSEIESSLKSFFKKKKVKCILPINILIYKIK